MGGSVSRDRHRVIQPAAATVLDGSLWPPLLGLLISLAVLYALGLLLLWRYARAHPDTLELRDALRLPPDVLRLVRRLAADHGCPGGSARVWVCCSCTSLSPSTWCPT